jgi:hypothetical protein
MTPDRIDSGLEQLSRLAASSRIDMMQYGQTASGDVTARAERLLRLIEVYVTAMPTTSKLDRALRRAVRMVECGWWRANERR